MIRVITFLFYNFKSGILFIIHLLLNFNQYLYRCHISMRITWFTFTGVLNSDALDDFCSFYLYYNHKYVFSLHCHCASHVAKEDVQKTLWWLTIRPDSRHITSMFSWGTFSLQFYLKMSKVGALIWKLQNPTNQPCKWHLRSTRPPGCSCVIMFPGSLISSPPSSSPASSLQIHAPHIGNIFEGNQIICPWFYSYVSSDSPYFLHAFFHFFVHSLFVEQAPIIYQALL